MRSVFVSRARGASASLRTRVRPACVRDYEMWPHRPPPRALASQYDRPVRFILVRHGESEGNVDEAAYVNTPDWKIQLTKRGVEQAAQAGVSLRKLMRDDEDCIFYVSPYKRTLQTYERMRLEIPRDNLLWVRQEPRIVEQQFGNFQDLGTMQEAKRKRRRFGRFFYRFPDGESGLDTYNRVTSFVSTVFRDCAQMRAETRNDVSKLNIVIVTHGLTLRLFLMRWFQLSVEEFEEMMNPGNAELVVMEREADESGAQHYELSRHAARSINFPWQGGGAFTRTLSFSVRPKGKIRAPLMCIDGVYR